MELLRELFNLVDLKEAAYPAGSSSPRQQTLGMVPLTSFISIAMTERAKKMKSASDTKITIEVPKPRAKRVNDILRSKRGGRHYDQKSDYNRAKNNQRERTVEEFI